MVLVPGSATGGSGVAAGGAGVAAIITKSLVRGVAANAAEQDDSEERGVELGEAHLEVVQELHTGTSGQEPERDRPSELFWKYRVEGSSTRSDRVTQTWNPCWDCAGGRFP
jgi:hypothetical protein